MDVSENNLTDLFCPGVDGSRVPTFWDRSGRPKANAPAYDIARYNFGLKIPHEKEMPDSYSAIFTSDETFVGFKHLEVPSQYDADGDTYTLVRAGYILALPATAILYKGQFLTENEVRARSPISVLQNLSAEN